MSRVLFVSAANKLGFMVHAKQMPPEHVATMMQYGAINQVQLGTISGFMTYNLSFKLFCSESEVKELSKNDYLPTNGVARGINNKTIMYWTKPVKRLVCHNVNKILLQDPVLDLLLWM